jgi:hypothetical protein
MSPVERMVDFIQSHPNATTDDLDSYALRHGWKFSQFEWNKINRYFENYA